MNKKWSSFFVQEKLKTAIMFKSNLLSKVKFTGESL